MDFTNLLALEGEPTLQAFVLWPGILLVAGLVVWWFGWRFERDDGNPYVKWAGMVLLAISVFMSYETFFLLIDTGVDGQSFRESFGNSRRLIYAGYFAFLAPLFAMIGFTIWFFVDKKLSKYR